ncbi:MAG: hypothetical protein WKF73_15560 [Nocardioidaceae bacterium]
MTHQELAPATNDDLLSRHRAVLPSWLALYYDEPIEIVSRSGSACDRRRLVERYLDFFAGILTNAVGYDIPRSPMPSAGRSTPACCTPRRCT